MNSSQAALQLLAATPIALRAVTTAVPNEALCRRPSTEAWSPQEVLAHLLRVEVTIGARVRLMVEQEEPVLTRSPLPQAQSGEAVLESWLNARQRNLQFLGGLTEDQLDRVGVHPRYGRVTVREHIMEWVHHDLDHLCQILTGLQAEVRPHIGAFRAAYEDQG